MPIFYKGVAPDTHYAHPDHAPSKVGFTALGDAKKELTPDDVVRHIADYDVKTTPYVSVTASLDVAKRYATPAPDSGEPGKVWKIDIDAAGLTNPLVQITRAWPHAHLHRGDPLAGKPGVPLVFSDEERELKAIFNAARDSELLVVGEIPPEWIQADPDEVLSDEQGDAREHRRAGE